MKNVFNNSPSPTPATEPEPSIPPMKKSDRGFRPGWPHVFAVCLTVGLLITWRSEVRQNRRERQRAQADTVQVAAALRVQLERAMSAVFPLEALVLRSAQSPPSLQSVGPRLLPAYPALVSLELQPGGVLRQIYPSKGNERLIGMNVLADPERRAALQEAISSRKIVVEGPAVLPSGESGLTISKPVYLPNTDGRVRFWGFVSGSVSLNRVLSEARFADLGPQGYAGLFAVSAVDGRSSQSLAAVGSPNLRNGVRVPFVLAGRQWLVSLNPEGGWGHPGRTAGKVFLTLILSTLAAGWFRSSERNRHSNRDLKETLEIVARNNDRFQALLEASPDAMVISDETGTITRVNTPAERLFGYRRVDLEGKPVEILMPESLRNEHRAHRKRFLASPTQRPMAGGLELAALRRDGKTVPVAVSLTPLKDNQGNPLVCSVIRDVSEHGRNQTDLEALQEKHRAITAHLPDWEIWLDVDHRPVWINPGVVEVTGYSMEECMGMAEYPQPILLDEDKDRFTGILNSGEEDIDIRFRRKDGAVRWGRLRWKAVTREDGVPLGHRAQIRDVTDFKQMEEEKELQLCFQVAILDTIPHPMFIMDSEARFAGCNKAFETAFGTSRKALKGKTWFDLNFIPPAKQKRFHDEDLEVIESASRRSYELPIRFADEKEHFTLYSVDGFRLPDGQPGGLIGLMVDISDLKQAQEEVQQQKRLFQQIIDNASAFIYVKDLEGRYVFVNRRYEDLLGISADQIIGKTAVDLFGDESGQAYEHGDEEVRQTRTLRKTEESSLLNGALHHFISHKFPLIDDNGNMFGTGGVSTDITGIKQAQEAIAEARDQAHSANEAKSAFLAMMSHEIRTPMNAILNMVALALDTQLTPQQHQYLSVVESSSKGLLALINDILDFSKIEAGRMELEKEPFSLRGLLEEVANTFRGRVLEKHLELIVNAAKNVPDRLNGDTLRLRQVLLNLVGNAFKFTDEGEVVVQVELLSDELPDDTGKGGHAELQFKVRDTGIGIPPDQMERIGHPFLQLDSSRARKQGGTGLGLAISRRLVDMMGGQLEVQSQVGRGSEFSFTARFEYELDTQTPAPPSPTSLSGLRVLVVEDNETSRELLGLLLEQFGFQSESVPSAEEAWRLLQKNQYDLAVLDWMLPGSDGLSLARRLRSTPQHKDLPVIMISCFAGKEEESLAQEAGINAFLLKPLTASILFDAISEVFRQTDNGETGSIPAAPPLPSVLQGKRILLVEDNEANQLVAVELLKPTGADIDIASNGIEALNRIDQKTYDAVLMDMQMPEMDGLEATRRIRSSRPDLQLPIIALTANAMKRDMEQCLEAGMDDYVAKPIDRIQLVRVLEKWMRNPSTKPGVVTTTSADLGADTGSLPTDSKSPTKTPPPSTEEDTPKPPPSPSAIESGGEQQFTAAKKAVRTLESSESQSSPPPRPGKKAAKNRQKKPSKKDPSQQELFADVDEEPADEGVPYGINVEDAVNRLGLSKSTLASVLRKFASGIRNDFDDLESAVEAGAQSEAIRHAHSIAGAAGNVSAELLHRLAKTLELAVKFEQGDIPSHLDHLRKELLRVIHSIQTVYGPVNKGEEESKDDAVETESLSEPERIQLKAKLTKLRDRLTVNDLTGVTQVAEVIRKGPMTDSLRSRLTEVEEQIDAFDYPAAVNHIERIISDL